MKLLCLPLTLAFAMLFCDARGQATSVDAAAWIAQQDARLGAAAGTIVLDRAAHLDRAVTIGANHNLQINAPLQITNAGIRLAGHNSVQCRAAIVADHVIAVFAADRGASISVSNCHASSITQTGYLLIASRSSGVTMTGNVVTGMGIFNSSNDGSVPTTNVTLSDNSSTFPKGGGEIGIYLLHVQHALVTNNRFQGNVHGIEWWGGDANGGWHGPESVTSARDIQATGNTCLHMNGACVWGSMGRDVTVSGNTADGCGDVCFDVEGGVNNVFTHNKAHDCGFGCYAAEFESDGTTFANNTSTMEAGGNHVLIKHNPGNGYSHTRFVVRDNVFTCTKGLCAALYSEGEDGILFTHNAVINGNIVTLNYHNDMRITANSFRFTVDMGATSAINGPALFNGHASEIADNQIVSDVKASKPNVCISQSYSDYNNVDVMSVLRNSCTGFNTGIATLSAGTNPGAPHAVWRISGNRGNGGKAFMHEHRSGNEDYSFTQDNIETGAGAPAGRKR